ncbi:MAG: GC-type dockerin domain-anchored protein, partial [Phycisphaerales bacterium JB039]
MPQRCKSGAAIAAAVIAAMAGTSYGQACYPDCDGSGTLDFFDFLCFQNAFATGDPYADCDGTGVLDFFDFLCFQNEFAMGCPGGDAVAADLACVRLTK